MNKGICALIW